MRHRLITRRAAVAVVALALHGMLLLVALLVRSPPRAMPALPQFVSLWVTEPSSRLPVPETATPAPLDPVQPDTSRATAPVLPEQQTEVAPATVEPGSAPPAAVDWMREGSLVARSHGEAMQTPQSDAFSKPPPKMREACVPKASSFKWNPEEKRAGFSGGLPFVRLGNCIVGLGFFACPLGAQPEPNSHLFDDLKDSNRQESSVPDPNHCD